MKKEPWYIRYSKKRPPTEVISANNEGEPYLLRWALIPNNKFFNVYLHNFIGPDQRVMHDHPWASLAYQLSGYLLETFIKRNGYAGARFIREGYVTYRSSKFKHYVSPARGKRTSPAWTLFFTGPKVRDWGFIENDKWIYWKDYIKNPQTNGKGDY